MRQELTLKEAVELARELCEREKLEQDVTEAFIQELSYDDPFENFRGDYLGRTQMIKDFAEWYTENKELMTKMLQDTPKCSAGCDRKTLVYLGPVIREGKKYRVYKCKVCGSERIVEVL